MSDDNIYTQVKIADLLRETVRGQTEAVQLLSYIGFTYLLNCQAMEQGFDRKMLPKLNVLMTGQTGFGKTFLVRELAKALKLPYTKIDVSTITGEGWQGPSLTSALADYVKQSQLGYGIIHLDEVDKSGFASNGDARDMKTDLQQNLLELLDGDYSVVENYKPGHAATDLSVVNKALIIMTGSFQKERDAKEATKVYGFHNRPEEKQLVQDGQSWKDKLTELGYMKEFAARIVHSIELHRYTKEEIIDIIKNSKTSALKKYEHLYGTSLGITDADIEGMAEVVMKSKNGIRELESLVFAKYFNDLKIQVN